MSKTILYLTRHGQTQWNAEGRMQGHGDSPLTDLGISQAIWLRDSLKDIPFTAIYASSSPRAQHTARILRDERPLEISKHDELRELGFGSLEGRTRAEMSAQEQEELTMFWEMPHLYKPTTGGESVYDLEERVVPFIKTLVERHNNETILIVAHALTLKMIMGYFEDRPIARIWDPPILQPTALNKVVIEDQQPVIELYGDTSHYQELEIN